MSVTADTSASGSPGDIADHSAANLESQLQGVVSSARRLAKLQVAIWLHGVKAALLRSAIIAGLCLIILLLVIVAIPFLYTGLYHVLTDILHVHTAWALLIFAGAHLLLAGALGALAIHVAKGGAGAKEPGGAA